MNRWRFLLATGSLCLACGCGGKVVVDGGQGGGGSTSADGSTSANGTSSVAVTGSSATGGAACDAHADCATGFLCVFATGSCARGCEAESCDACDPGTVCDGCATSACPDCLDCRGACLPTAAGRCDENDPCPSGGVCLWFAATCAPPCSADGTCADPSLVCTDCVTGSCCGCEDCQPACVP